jgi:hypothetical protein
MGTKDGLDSFVDTAAKYTKIPPKFTPSIPNQRNSKEEEEEKKSDDNNNNANNHNNNNNDDDEENEGDD